MSYATYEDGSLRLGGYAATDALDRTYSEHYSQWDIDRAAIAKKFRRKWVKIGEQTVPGKCCVRSSRGQLLGYAHVWNGKWLGTVERV